MNKVDKIPSYSNENFLDKIKQANSITALKGRGRFKYNAVFIDLNAVRCVRNKKIALTCNFRCPGCFKYLEQQAHATDRLNIKEIKNIIDFAKSRGVKAVVYAGLGEPMMDQDFWHALDYAYKQKMWTVLFTNGTFISKSNAKILFKKKMICIIKRNTLNDEKQDLMVGNIKGASKRMREGLEYLISTGFKSPRLVIDSVITNNNFEDLKDLLRFCRKNKIIPYFEAFITKTVEEKDYKNLILTQDKFDKLFLELQKIDKEEFGINTKLTKGMRVYGQNPCIKYWTMFSVRNNDDVALCVSDSKIIGNIRKQSFEKILTPKNKKIVTHYKLGCNCSMTTSKMVEKD